MVARAHVVHDYSFAGASVRPRRQVWLQDDEPVVLPRGNSEARSGAVLIVSALLASVLVAGATYGVYRTAPPELAETSTLPFTKTWVPDAELIRASTTNALLGPAQAVPSVEGAASAAPTEPLYLGDLPQPRSQSNEVTIDDSAPGLQEVLPQPTPDQPALLQDPVRPQEIPPSASPQVPYPSPTTPPEMVAPSGSSPEAPAVDLDQENPY
jgi:hypothetical protein